ncbi:MAG: hypothetical protein LBL87_02505 [Ruminococcus sp.]|nr:hypothetical protein [Ruminococcus sp.]
MNELKKTQKADPQPSYNDLKCFEAALALMPTVMNVFNYMEDMFDKEIRQINRSYMKSLMSSRRQAGVLRG